jgi:hypothetical protein
LVELGDDKLNKTLKQLLEDKTLRMSLASNARLTAKEFSNCWTMTEYTETVLLTVAGSRTDER